MILARDQSWTTSPVKNIRVPTLEEYPCVATFSIHTVVRLELDFPLCFVLECPSHSILHHLPALESRAMRIVSLEESRYAPNGYILSKPDFHVIAILMSARVNPDTWQSVWSNLGFETFADFYNISKAHIRSLGLLVVAELSMLRAVDALRTANAQQDFPPFICSCGKDHTPKTVARRKEIRYWMFQAAFQGCLPCVQQCIEVIGVDPYIQSCHEKYTAKSWAQWGHENDVPGTEEVVAYLDSLAAQQ